MKGVSHGAAASRTRSGPWRCTAWRTAVASLGCTLPVFLIVVGISLTAGAGRALVFVAYALGMGAVLMAVALGAVLFQGAISRYLRTVIPYVQQVGALLHVVAGIYMVATQLPILVHQRI